MILATIILYSLTPGDILPSDTEIIDAVDSACRRLAYKFKFGYHEVEDMKQEAYVFAMDVINKGRWDETRPLKNFIYVHIHNRFCNFKRKHYQRLATPCEKCPLSAYIKKGDVCTEYSDKLDCKWYYAWTQRNESKKCLMHSVEITSMSHPSILHNDKVDNKDYLLWISGLLPEEFLEVWGLAYHGKRYNGANFKEMVGWVQENIKEQT